jgi:ATPase family associated with various cellular activities (AAA)
MLTIPKTLLEHSDYPPLRDRKTSWSDDLTIKTHDLDDKMVEAIHAAAEKAGETGLVRALGAMIAARSGDTSKPVPRLVAFPDMLLSFLRANFIDGWLYAKDRGGHYRPWLVTDVKYVEGSSKDDKPRVTMSMVADGSTSSGSRSGSGLLGQQTTSVTFFGSDVVKKKVSAALEAKGYLIETEDLKAAYLKEMEVYDEIISGGFSEQYRYSGRPDSGERYGHTPNERRGIKVIHDIRKDEIAPSTDRHMTTLIVDADGDDGSKGFADVPVHFNLRVFDLSTHEFLWVHTSDLKRYVYDKTLRHKIVLPEDQRTLLDILTTNLDDFTGDVIEGKGAGNVVLCKGKPGVGKTLTAEVYSELIERPLYSIHSGSLGVTADSVRQNLEVIFQRSTRWNSVLLLDEADVFVLERGDNLQQNAIVAEFLRTLEYFMGLMFMTTNRANNIDDAILSRAAAIIDYPMPGKEAIREVWKVQAANQNVEIPDDLLDEWVGGFKVIAPRDVKMLLRLALRVAAGQGTDLSTEIIAKCAMFRGLHFALGSRVDGS